MQINYRKFMWIMMLLLIMSLTTFVILNNKSNTNKYSRAKLIYIEQYSTRQRA